MLLRVCALLCVLFTIAETKAFAKRDVSSQPNNAFVSIQKNLDNFRRCLDQSLAAAIEDVNEKQLQPVFSVIGDGVKRVSKANDASVKMEFCLQENYTTFEKTI